MYSFFIGPFECSLIKYTKTTSFSEYPTPTALKSLLSGSTFLSAQAASLAPKGDTVANYVLKVNVFYEFLSYGLLTDSVALDLPGLLGGMGGTLGK